MIQTIAEKYLEISGKKFLFLSFHFFFSEPLLFKESPPFLFGHFSKLLGQFLVYFGSHFDSSAVAIAPHNEYDCESHRTENGHQRNFANGGRETPTDRNRGLWKARYFTPC